MPDTGSYLCRPYVGGNSETCNESSPAEGILYIGIRGYSSFANLSLTASFQVVVQDGFTLTDLAAGQGEWLFYTIQVTPGATSLNISTSLGTGDGDLYVRAGSAPDLNNWDYRPYAGGNVETVTVPNPTAGEWHMGIRGYNAFSGLKLEAYQQH